MRVLCLLVFYRNYKKMGKGLCIDDILSQHLSAEQIAAFKQSGTGIRSITVYAEKPVAEKAACCGPECCSPLIPSKGA